MTILDTLQAQAVKQYERQGVQVYIKTDVTPELKVYDSDNSGGDAGASESGASLLNFQIKVKNRQGSTLVEYGEAKTSYIKSVLFYGVIGFGLFVAFKGLKGTYETIKK